MRTVGFWQEGDDGYRWTMVSFLSLAELVSWGTLYYAFTGFIDPMRQHLGWSLAAITGAFSLGLLVSGAAGLGVGYLVDRYGARWVMTGGSVGASALVFGWSHVHSVAAFYLLWAGLGVCMAAVLYDPAFAVIAVWFRQERSRALSLLTLVAGLSSIIFVPLTERLVSAYGWRTALTLLALLLLVVTVPLHGLGLRGKPASRLGGKAQDERSLAPEGEEPSATLREAVSGRSFRWVSVAFSLNLFVTTAMAVHLVPFLERQGYSPAFAAEDFALIGLISLPGRAALTLVGDRISRYGLTASIFLLQAVGLLLLLVLPAFWGPLIFSVLFGVGFGAITPSRAAIVAEQYGSQSYGRIHSVLGMALATARALSPVAVGILAEIGQGYQAAFFLLTGGLVLAAFSLWMADRSRPDTGP